MTLNPKCQGLIANQMRKQSPSRGHLKSSPSPSACFRSPADRLNHALGAPGLLAFACCASSYPCHHMSKRTRKIPAPASSFTCHTPLPCCGVCVHAQPRPPHLAFQQPVFLPCSAHGSSRPAAAKCDSWGSRWSQLWQIRQPTLDTDFR